MDEDSWSCWRTSQLNALDAQLKDWKDKKAIVYFMNTSTPEYQQDVIKNKKWSANMQMISDSKHILKNELEVSLISFENNEYYPHCAIVIKPDGSKKIFSLKENDENKITEDMANNFVKEIDNFIAQTNEDKEAFSRSPGFRLAGR